VLFGDLPYVRHILSLYQAWVTFMMSSPEQTTGDAPTKGGFTYLVKNPYLVGVALVKSPFPFHQALDQPY
jgi:hypothetical protein